ncbi:Esa1p-associated factor [Sorochytrium milnesiophthora]
MARRPPARRDPANGAEDAAEAVEELGDVQNVEPAEAAAQDEGERKEQSFVADERVLCYHGLLVYEAKVQKAEMRAGLAGSEDTEVCQRYLIHYKGWNSSWDEWVKADRLLKFTDENLLLQRDLKDQHLPGRIVTTPTSKASATLKEARKRGTTGYRSRDEDGNSSAGAANQSKKRKAEAVSEPRDKSARADVAPKDPNRPKVRLPSKLRLLLTDDWERVSSKQQLVSLPRKPSIDDIMEEYKLLRIGEKVIKSERANRLNKAQSTFEEFMKGMTLYFDKCLGARLLYSFERPQYREVYERLEKEQQQSVEASGVPPVSKRVPLTGVYGVEHLVRLLALLSQLIVEAKVDTETADYLAKETSELASEEEQSRFFVGTYDNADPNYLNLAKTIA